MHLVNQDEVRIDCKDKFEGTTVVIRSHKEGQIIQWPKEKGQRDKHKDLQNITQKTKDQATRTPLKTGEELGCPIMVSSSSSTYDSCCATVKQHEHRS